MGLAAMSRLYHAETVPFTGRTHIVLHSHHPLRVATEIHFVNFKKDHAAVILPENHETTVRVNRVLTKIVGAIGPRLASRTQEPLGWAARLDWEVVVLRDDSIRARCWAGGGKIAIHTGLLDCFGTEEEIGVVLAHEVGHVIARHCSELIERFANWEWFPTFLLTPFFRRCELEADYIGMILLAASGFDPHIAPQTLKKLAKMGRKYIFRHRLYSLAFSTHPSPKERLKFLLRPNVMEEAMELYTHVTSGSSKAF